MDMQSSMNRDNDQALTSRLICPLSCGTLSAAQTQCSGYIVLVKPGRLLSLRPSVLRTVWAATRVRSFVAPLTCCTIVSSLLSASGFYNRGNRVSQFRLKVPSALGASRLREILRALATPAVCGRSRKIPDLADFTKSLLSEIRRTQPT